MPDFGRDTDHYFGVSYNGIWLSGVRTNVYDAQAVYSDDGADYLFTRYLIDVTAIFSPGATAYAPAGGAGTVPAHPDAAATPIAGDPANPATFFDADVTHAWLRERLLCPRKQLIYRFGGHDQLVSPRDGYDSDVDGGPIPKAVSVTRVTGSKTWIVNYRVETTLRDCDVRLTNGPNAGTLSPILSNRYEMSDETDRDLWTTRTIRGTSRFRQDVLKGIWVDAVTTEAATADTLRRYCVPPVTPGMRREKISVAMNTKGDLLHWSVVDKEVRWDLGDRGRFGRRNKYGVTTVKGVKITQTATPPGDDGAPAVFLQQSLALHIEGSPQSLPSNLIKYGVLMAAEQLGLVGPWIDATKHPMLMSTRIVEHIDQNKVAVDMDFSTRVPPGLYGAKAKNPGKPVMAPRWDLVGFDEAAMLPKGGVSPVGYYDGGTRAFNCTLFAEHLRAGCCQDGRIIYNEAQFPGRHRPPSDIEPSPGEQPEVEAKVYESLDEERNLLHEEQSRDLFTDYKVNKRVITDYHKLQLPRTGATRDYNGNPVRGRCAVIEVAQPTSRIVYDWTAERVGEQPYVPSPKVLDTQHEILGAEVIPAAVHPGPDGNTPIYRISGTYEYAIRDALQFEMPSGTGGVVNWPTLAITRLVTEQVALAPDRFVHGLTGPSQFVDNTPSEGGVSKPVE